MNTRMTDSTAEVRVVRRAHLMVTSLVAALSVLALVLVIVLSAGDLPDRMATHFDVSGASTDDMPKGVALGFFALIGVGVPTLLIAVFATTQWWRGEWARAFAGFLAGFSVWLGALFALQVVANTGASAPEDVTFAPWTILLTLALGLVIGTVVALLVPRGVPWPPSQSVTPVVLTPTERASWFGRAQMGWLPMAALAATVLVLVVAALASGIWWLWLVVALVAVLVVAVTAFVVTVDASGVSWRSVVGLPRGHVPMSQITGAAVIQISPADFGGFGLRMTPRGLGLITRRGPALEVRHGKRRLVATVDDPATAAGLVLGYLESSRKSSGT